MARSVFMTLAMLAATAVPALAQGIPVRPPTPGTGECPEGCAGIWTPIGALITCCGDGCVDCSQPCMVSCASGKAGGCIDMGDDDTTCSKGCDLFCDGGDYEFLEMP